MKKVCVFLISILFVFCFVSCQPKTRTAGNNLSGRLAEYTFYINEGGSFELPVAGASGYTAISIPVFETANVFTNFVAILDAGQGFTILREENDWWHIEVNNIKGWVLHKYCFINLPDVIPSIVYNITNTYSSLFRSSGIDIPNITGRALYDAWGVNARLGREEYIAPVLYAMAGKIFAAQQAALADGNTLIIYETFRPAEAHNELHKHFSNLVNTNPLVRSGITANNFNIRWFLAEAPYNHQRGTAIDASLGKIDSSETRAAGSYAYTYITSCTEYSMQTEIHELSVAAAVFDSSVHARSTTSWIGAAISDKATIGTILLQKYCTDAGLIPLASEWWHFNDLVNTAVAIDMDITGEFFIRRTYSRPPGFD
jgi:D-alanyl-D-alanine dipeptidase